jgi:hypothetical protein
MASEGSATRSGSRGDRRKRRRGGRGVEGQRHGHLRHGGGIGLRGGGDVGLEGHAAGLEAEQVALGQRAVLDLAAQQRLGAVEAAAVAQRDLEIGAGGQRRDEVLPQREDLDAERVEHLRLGDGDVLVGEARPQLALAAELDEDRQPDIDVVGRARGTGRPAGRCSASR